MPSLPSSASPIATRSPRRSRRGSMVSSPSARLTTTQSIRGREGASQRPSTCRYVGRLDVEKKPSGRTPSAGIGSKRAAGAPVNGGAEKSGLVEGESGIRRMKLGGPSRVNKPRLPSGMTRGDAMQRSIVLLALAFAAPKAAAQVPTRPDTLVRDTTATQLPEIQVTVTRSPEPLERVPYAVGVLDRNALQRGQQTLGIDEALNNLPGVVVSNRYNYSLDQRISIRGFGSRSNFGVRGLKILLDGIPQTLPDGQSQLTNIDFADIDRAEVLRGASSSLYRNASGGVISFQTERAAPGPFAQRVRVQGGSGDREGDGFYKWQSWTSARSGSISGTLSVSQFKADGFRQHSAAEFRQLNGGVDYAVSGSTLATLRLSLADNPRAQNPGALTFTEYATNPDSAARNNILRGADKDAQQHQLALGLRHFDTAGNEYEAAVFGLVRDLANPLAAPPFSGAPQTAGTYVAIDRAVGGIRGSANRRLGTSDQSPRLTAGVDLQRMRDDRQNFVSDAGTPTAAVLLDQREQVTELGPFAQVQWSPHEQLVLSSGIRYDW